MPTNQKSFVPTRLPDTWVCLLSSNSQSAIQSPRARMQQEIKPWQGPKKRRDASGQLTITSSHASQAQVPTTTEPPPLCTQASDNQMLSHQTLPIKLPDELCRIETDTHPISLTCGNRLQTETATHSSQLPTLFPPAAVTAQPYFHTTIKPEGQYFKQSVYGRRPLIKHSGPPRTKSLIRPSFDDLSRKLGYLHRPQPSTEFTERYPDLSSLYQAVVATKQPNHRLAKSPVHHALKLHNWDNLLVGYHDTTLTAHLRYGFPLRFATKCKPTTDTLNHSSTLANPSALDNYLHTELQHKAIAGPFKTPPFKEWFHISPMMLRDKKNTTEKRVIVDLSWPLGQSVNANIPYDVYEGAPAHMTLPTAEDLAAAILAAPPTAHVYCIDLSRAYRQLRIDAQEWPLLGLKWKGAYYFDQALAFRGRWHAAACQRVTQALRHIQANLGAAIWPYLDDIAGLADDYQQALTTSVTQSLGA